MPRILSHVGLRPLLFVLLLLALIAALLDMGTVLAGRTPTLLPRPVPGQLHWRAKSNLD